MTSSKTYIPTSGAVHPFGFMRSGNANGLGLCDQLYAPWTGGVVATAVWTVGISFLIFKLLQATVGLRVSPQHEADGLTMAGDTHEPAEKLDGIDRDELRRRLGG